MNCRIVQHRQLGPGNSTTRCSRIMFLLVMLYINLERSFPYLSTSSPASPSLPSVYVQFCCRSDDECDADYGYGSYKNWHCMQLYVCSAVGFDCSAWFSGPEPSLEIELFSVASLKVWNSLPECDRTANTSKSVNCSLETHFLDRSEYMRCRLLQSMILASVYHLALRGWAVINSWRNWHPVCGENSWGLKKHCIR